MDQLKQSSGLSQVIANARSIQENVKTNAAQKKDSLRFSALDFAELEENIEKGALTPEQLKEAQEKRNRSVEQLAVAVTSRVQRRAIELSALDHRVLMSMHSEIITLFERSRDRFDKDGEKGLDAGEFYQFSESMVSKVEKIVSTYAPTAEEIAAKKEAEEAFKEAEEAAEEVEEIDLEEVPDDPGEILDLPTLAKKFEYYDKANRTLQKKAVEAMGVAARATEAHATLIDRRNKLEASKKFRQFFGMEDKEMESLKKLLNDAKEKVEATKEKVEEVADRLESYGEKMAEASNEQKRKLMEEERQGHLDRIAGYKEEGVEQTEEEKTRYKQLKDHKEALEANKADLEFYKQMVLEGEKDKINDRILYAEVRQVELQTYGNTLADERERMDNVVENLDFSFEDENLSRQQEAQKEAILLARAQLDEREKGLQLAQMGAGAVLGENQEAWEALSEEDRAIAEGTYNTDLQLATVEQDMQNIDQHLGVIRSGMIEYTDSEAEVEAYYAEVAETYDGIDEAIDTSITNNNIAITQTSVSLDQQANALGGMKIEKPGWFESTIGVPFATFGGVVEKGGEWILEQSKDLSRQLREMDKDAMGSAYYWSRKIIGTPAVAVLGFTGAGVKMGAGLVSVPASWENISNFGNGLTSMAGLDFKGGRYFGGVGLETWGNIINESIPYEDFKDGDWALGGGKLVFNLLATAIGGKAVGAGKKAAIKGGQKAMRQAIESGQSAMGVLWAGASKGMLGGAEGMAVSVGADLGGMARTAANVGKVVVGGAEKLARTAVKAVARAERRGVGEGGATRKPEGPTREHVFDEALELSDENLIQVQNSSGAAKPVRTRRGTEVAPEGSQPPQVGAKPPPIPETFIGPRPTKTEPKRPGRRKSEKSPVRDLMGEELGAISELEATQIRGDKKVLDEVFGEHRDNPQRVTEMLGEAVKGEKNALSPVLENLKQRDPEAYNLIKNTDPEILIDSNCLEPIISGRKKEIVDREGDYLVIYEGKPLGKGTVGEVNAVLYCKPGDKGLSYGAYKQQRRYDETTPDPETGRTPMEQLVHEHEAAGFGSNEAGIRAAMGKMFDQELNDAQLLQETNNPHLIGIGAIGPDFIIYETAPGAKVAFDVFNEVPPKQSLAILGDMGKGVQGMHKAGYSHGDIKPENVLVLPDGSGEYKKAVIIDPSANKLENGALATGTPDFFFTPDEVADFKTKAKAEGKTGLKTEKEINSWAARACDNRALAYSLESSGILDLDPKSASKLGLTPEDIRQARLGNPSWSLEWILSLDPQYHKQIGLTPEQLNLLKDTQRLIEDGKNIEIAGSPNYTIRFNSVIKRLEAEAEAYQAGKREVGLFYDPTQLLAAEAISSAN